MTKDSRNIINVDFQGWPEYKMSIRDILLALGGKYNKETNKIEFENNGPWLHTYPIVLEDDGMGYGVNKKFITEVSTFEDESGTQSVNIFIEKELPKEELKEIFGEEYPDDFQLVQ